MPDWRFTTYVLYACKFTQDTVPGTNKEINAACGPHKDETVKAIKQIRPDVVFILNNYQSNAASARPAYIKSQEDIIARFRTSVKTVALLSPAPFEKNPKVCYTPRSTPADCLNHVTSGYWGATADANRSVARDESGVFVDTRPMYCDKQGACPAFIGRVPVRVDTVHMTTEFQNVIAPALKELLVAAHVI
jgi:hypothetical protein